MDSRGGGQIDSGAVMEQVRAEMANAYWQEFFSSVRDKCFDKCITRPGSSMSSSEVQCLAKCCDRYVEATKVVSGTVLQTLKQAQAQEGLSELH